MQYRTLRHAVLVDGIPEEVPKRDKALVEAAARFGGDRGKNNFHPDTNQRDIEFTFSDWVNACGFRDRVNTMPGMKVFMVSRSGGGSNSGGSWH